ncbi:cell division protein ZapA [Swingsia samuiensis]|uniref:Cell division protein ZapA n=1 Tax=Swingsia samuiensis TaxID=1293412 RepID=A0A4Y6UI58_9PROT|nr:cell division protein ZapA [Swingsia samuiensis]QDH16348.1 cell division protein ZapA [Swingsia samuiensis]
MGQVSIRLNGYVYNVGCQDGEEHHLYAMVRQVEGWLQKARNFGGVTSESKTLVMAALLMADEIYELKNKPLSDEVMKTVETAQKALQASAKNNDRLSNLANKAELLAQQIESEN